MNNTFFENNFATYHFENEIVVITFKKFHGTLQSSIEIVDGRIKFTEGKTYPILADVRLITGSNKEALDYFDTETSIQGSSVVAILTESFISKFFANIFLRLNSFKNKIPTRVFNNKNDAMNWLKQKQVKSGS